MQIWKPGTGIEPGYPHDEESAVQAKRRRQEAKGALRKRVDSVRPAMKLPRRADATVYFERVRTVDIVDWLAIHPTELDQIEWASDQIGDACWRLLLEVPLSHVRLADHLWCDVLAALVKVIDDALARIDELPRLVSEELAKEWAKEAAGTVRAERDVATGGTPVTRKRTTGTRVDRERAAGLSEAILRQVVDLLPRAPAEAGHHPSRRGAAPVIHRRVPAILAWISMTIALGAPPTRPECAREAICPTRKRTNEPHSPWLLRLAMRSYARRIHFRQMAMTSAKCVDATTAPHHWNVPARQVLLTLEMEDSVPIGKLGGKTP